MHSVHNSLFEDGMAWIRLKWSSARVNPQIIPSIYFFTKIPDDPIRLGD